LQGGIHPELDIDYYVRLLKDIKKRYSINIHGFSPPEINYLAKKHDLTIRETLLMLKQAGLDSIPGGGAEILSDRVREILSPKKIKSPEWLKVMEEAHNIGMRTTATMMFGSIEEPEDIIEHLDAIRTLQDKTGGFTAFIPWSFQTKNTDIIQDSRFKIQDSSAVDYLRVLAVSRIYLDNIKNIQASWVTQGLKLAQVALRFGANDFGSTMIEENVVRAAGVSYRVSKEDIIQAIKGAGFKPAQRDTYYNLIKEF
jgi:cyclic dehypoxanthinyl futalosine synthase